MGFALRSLLALRALGQRGLATRWVGRLEQLGEQKFAHYCYEAAGA